MDIEVDTRKSAELERPTHEGVGAPYLSIADGICVSMRKSSFVQNSLRWKSSLNAAVLLAASLFLTGQALSPAERPSQPHAAGPQLWYMNHSYLANDDALAASKKLVDHAAELGYNGVMFWDSGFNFMSDEFWPWENEARLGELMKYAAKKGLRTMATPSPYGYSNEALYANPNWAESQRIIGALFQVDPSGKHLIFKDSFPGLKNAGFEEGKSDWFDTGDAGTGISTNAHSGKNAAVIVNASGNARLRQKFPLKPWRQYHLRAWVKTENFAGNAMIEVLDSANYDLYRLGSTFHVSGTHDWTQVDLAFNSQDTTQGILYLGVWGGSTGTIWFDDLTLEETSLVYVTRRSGTPLRVYDPSQPETVFKEGTDFNAIADPRMSERAAFHDSYHASPVVTLPPHTHLKAGQIVAMDYYAAFPLPDTLGISMCMTEPAAWKWVVQNTQEIKKQMAPNTGILLGYDEIRQMNSCASCRAKNMDAGALLAWSIKQLIQLHRSVTPAAQLYIYNDMIDPYHNAQKHYYSVEGDLTGGWNGVPPDVIVLNWNLGNLKKSLSWFAGQDPRWPVFHQQLIAGYYDNSGGGAAAAKEELDQAAGIPGILGLMYFSWSDNYSQLQSFADSAHANWARYQVTLRQTRP